MTKSSVFIIAEAGVNHNGDVKLAYKLCDAAKEAGVNAVKFQTWKTEKIVTKSAALAEYQENTIHLLLEMLKQIGFLFRLYYSWCKRSLNNRLMIP